MSTHFRVARAIPRFVTAAPTTTYAAEILADSPALYLKMDEVSNGTATDSSGNGHNGTHSNVTLGQASLLTSGTGTSASYNGSSATTLVVGAAWMETATLTVSARVRWNSGVATFMVSRWVIGGHRPWLFTINASGHLELGIDDQAALITGSSVLSTTVPSTVAFVVNGTTLQLFVNGVLDGSISHAGPTQTGNDLEIGRAAGAVYSTLNIDEVAFWKTALSSTRLAAQHAAA